MKRYAGTVWHEEFGLILLIVDEPDAKGRMRSLILDEGIWPTRSGKFYPIHVVPLRRNYEMIT